MKRKAIVILSIIPGLLERLGSVNAAFFIEPLLFILPDFADNPVVEVLRDMEVVKYRLNPIASVFKCFLEIRVHVAGYLPSGIRICRSSAQRRRRTVFCRRDYLKEAKRQAGYRELSPDGMTKADGDEISGEELIKDESQNVEATVMIRIMKEKLRAAVMSLSDEERDLIEEMYLRQRPMTESEYAAHIGQRRSYVNFKKRVVLEKLRVMLGCE